MVNAINYWYQKYLQEKEKNQGIKSNDLEDFAKKESESFAEREYEIGYIDRNALAKGYYWGLIAGAQWQKQRTDEAMTEALRTEYEKGRADTIAEIGKKFDDCRRRQDIMGFLESLRLKEE